MSAAAPSFTPDELPAVTVPPARKGVFSRASPSASRLRTRMLVAFDEHGGLRPRDLNRHDLTGKEPG